MTPLSSRSAEERTHLMQIALSLFQMGHAPDTIACALGCHEGLSIGDAVSVTDAAGVRWSAALWTCATTGTPLPPLPKESVDELMRMVTTAPPGASVRVAIASESQEQDTP